MEKIELRVETVSGVEVDRHWFAVFGVAGGTIGRGGQNKLVLPDADSGVARVHAMVRLESDAAYIANLCERRSMQVAGQALASGEEVQLPLGTEIQIGPYCLRALAPGLPWPTTSTPPAGRLNVAGVQASAAAVRTTTNEAASSSPRPSSILAATPNPWADIPQQSRGEFGPGPLTPQQPEPQSPHLPLVQQEQGTAVDVSLGTLLGSNTVPAVADADNPFAMLGRVEGGAMPLGGLPAKAATVVAPVAAARPTASSQATPTGSPFDLPVAQSAFAATAAAPSAMVNVLDGLNPPARPAAVSPNRPLLIPEDYDLFAPDAKKEAQRSDPFGAGLPAQSLTEVAKVRNDGLLRSLPISGPVDEPMDNPAHSGLPKALEPGVELDPMRLFQSPGAMNPSPVAHAPAASRGAELAQVFSLPRGAAAAVASLPVQPVGAAALVPETAPAQAPAPSPSHRHPTGLVTTLGLNPTQGLDLALFDAVGGTSVNWASAAPSDPAPLVSPPQSPATVSPPPSTPVAVAVAVAETAPLWSSPVALAPAQAPAPAPVPSRPSIATAGDAVVGPVTASLDLDLDVPSRPAALPTPQTAQSEEGAEPLDTQALIHAFLDGAGLARGRVEAHMSPEFMRDLGEAFRVAVQGTMELLAARSEIKREFRADVTIIAPRANNPLKFLPNADGVMMQMLGQSFPGFMKPVPSMKEAYFDLQVHQLALMAGIRAAYSEALARFDPVELEKRSAAEAGLLGRFSPNSRKAALWDEYKNSFSAMRRHAEDDLQAFSGQTFVDAYEAAAEAARMHP